MTQMGLPLSASGGTSAPPPAPRVSITADYGTVLSLTELAEFAAALSSEGEVGLEIATTEDSPTRGALIGFALAGKNGRARYVPLGHVLGCAPAAERCRDGRSAGHHLRSEGAALYAHDLKRSDVALAQAGLRIGRYGFDSSLCSYLLDPEARHDRVSLAQRELGLVTGPLADLGKPARGKRVPLDELPIEPVASWLRERRLRPAARRAAHR